MSRSEFLAWAEYYRRWPFDDMHRYVRPAAMVSCSAGGGDVRERIDWLQPPSADQFDDADLNTLRAFGLRR